MKGKVDFLSIIGNSKLYREKEYIDYFFAEIAGIKNSEPIFEQFDNHVKTYVSIVKDSTERILGTKNGKLMERTWRNTIFYFVDKKTYIAHFGTNSAFPNYKIQRNVINYTGDYNSVNAKNPNDPKLHWDIFHGFQSSMFEIFKNTKSSWFIRSYVYFVMVLCDKDTKITDKDFNIYYWNTNYSFTQVSGKKVIFNNVTNSYFVADVKSELSLIENTNRDVIDCVKAYLNVLDFRNLTDENFYDIKADIDRGINYILVRGPARTGKTILAMRILGTYPESKFLIMNYYFYIALKDSFKIQNVVFPLDRIFHHDLSRSNGCWIRNKKTKTIKPTLDFLIVDEAQRLAYIREYVDYVYDFTLPELDEIKKILFDENQKTTILFGDDFQKLNPLYDEGFSKIYDQLQDKNYREYFFKKSIGVTPEILINIKHLLNMKVNEPVMPTNNFSFELTDNEDVFISEFNEDQISKKHYVCVGLNQLSDQIINYKDGYIGEYPDELKKKDFPYFFNNEIKKRYMLSTYEVISREIESVYLFLPEEITFDEIGKSISFKNTKDIQINDFLINHIYTLMTRATLKLNILCKDTTLYAYFKSIILEIESCNADYLSRDEKVATMDYVEEQVNYDYDLFIAYHGTNDPHGSYSMAKYICDYLKDHGLTVFLCNYSYIERDKDLGFNETKYVIQRSRKMLFVLNDSIPSDEHGMLLKKNLDNKKNQLYSELLIFDSLVDDDLRTYKTDFRFFYDGSNFDKFNIYNFLNRLYRVGTMGNSNCCLFSKEEVLKFVSSN